MHVIGGGNECQYFRGAVEGLRLENAVAGQQECRLDYF